MRYKKYKQKNNIYIIFCSFFLSVFSIHCKIPLFWYKPNWCVNFGDDLSHLIVSRIIKRDAIFGDKGKKLLALGSILHFAQDGDVIWGSGLNGKVPAKKCNFKKLDVRAVRGPITRQFLLSKGINCPEIYGDPALLLPLLFPELKAKPIKDFIVIPNLNEISYYKKFPNLILPTQSGNDVIKEILKAKFVISGSLHGLIVAEAFGIPARLLRISNKESIIKYKDYYLGTGRKSFKYATSLKQAHLMRGEAPPKINLKKLLNSFPLEYFI